MLTTSRDEDVGRGRDLTRKQISPGDGEMVCGSEFTCCSENIALIGREWHLECRLFDRYIFKVSFLKLINCHPHALRPTVRVNVRGVVRGCLCAFNILLSGYLRLRLNKNEP